MSDIAIYRAIESVAGEITRVWTDDVGQRRALLKLDRDLTSVVYVKVFEASCPEVLMLAPRYLEIVIPLEYAKQPEDSWVVTVLAEVSLAGLQGVMSPGTLGLGQRPQLVTGDAEAVQRAVRWLSMDPGTDVWDKARGGGLRRAITSNLTGSDLSAVTKRITIILDRYNSFPRKQSGTNPRYVRRIELTALRVVTPETLSVLSTGADSRFAESYRDLRLGEVSLALSLTHSITGAGSPSTVSSSLVV